LWSIMVFDILSFLAGVAAGAIAGALAGILHGLEGTADLQEKLRQVTREVEKMKRGVASTSELKEDVARSQLGSLSRDLDDIHEEIRRMYKKGTS
jgi:gas vesicle protein